MTAYPIRPHIKLWKKRNRNQQKHTELWSGGILCLLQIHKKPRLVNWCLGVSTQVALHLSLSMCYSSAQNPASGRKREEKVFHRKIWWTSEPHIELKWTEFFIQWVWVAIKKGKQELSFYACWIFERVSQMDFTPVQTNPIDVVSTVVLLLLPVFWPKQ